MKKDTIVCGYNSQPIKREIHTLNDIGTQISTYRKDIGMTQEQLGNQIGMGKDRISKIEKGGNPTIETLATIFSALNADLSITVEPQVSYDSSTVGDLILSIFEFAQKNGLSQKQAYRYLKRFGAIDFYIRHAEIEKAVPLDETMEDFMNICKNNYWCPVKFKNR